MTKLDILTAQHETLKEIGGWIEEDKHVANTATLNYVAGVIDVTTQLLKKCEESTEADT